MEKIVDPHCKRNLPVANASYLVAQLHDWGSPLVTVRETFTEPKTAPENSESRLRIRLSNNKFPN